MLDRIVGKKKIYNIYVENLKELSYLQHFFLDLDLPLERMDFPVSQGFPAHLRLQRSVPLLLIFSDLIIKVGLKILPFF